MTFLLSRLLVALALRAAWRDRHAVRLERAQPWSWTARVVINLMDNNPEPADGRPFFFTSRGGLQR